jgi:hypothetical protein
VGGENLFRFSKLLVKSPMIGRVFEEEAMTTERELREWRDRRANQGQSVRLKTVTSNPLRTVLALIAIAAFTLAFYHQPKSEQAPRPELPESVTS